MSKRPKKLVLSRSDITGLFDGPPAIGARVIMATFTILTVVVGLIPSASSALTLGAQTFGAGQLLALVTNCLVSAPGSPIFLIILLALTGFFRRNQVLYWWTYQRVALITTALLIIGVFGLINYLLGDGLGWGLGSGLILLLWFSTHLERTWGTTRILVFVSILMVVVNVIGASLLYAWPAGMKAALTPSAAPVSGLSPLISAFLTVWCLQNAEQRFELLNVTGKTLIWILVLIGVLNFLLAGRIAAVMELAGIGVTWLLVSGNWRPKHLIDRFQLWRIERRIARRRQNLKVVDGGGDRTLH